MEAKITRDNKTGVDNYTIAKVGIQT